jgi:hypothetical protein
MRMKGKDLSGIKNKQERSRAREKEVDQSLNLTGLIAECCRVFSLDAWTLCF